MQAESILAACTLTTDDTPYRIIHLPAAAITPAAGVLAEIGTAFSTLVADKDEVTLILPDAEWQTFAGRLIDAQNGGLYRLITFDQPLEPDLVGFMALVSRVLAAAGISLLAISAFERDHILVPDGQLAPALDALRAEQQRLAQQD